MMLIMGISGGLDPAEANYYNHPYDYAHDAAAVLLADGEVVAGIEEERLNRIKHTNKSGAKALRFCLDHINASPEDIDAYAYYATEAYCRQVLNQFYSMHPEISERLDVRTTLVRSLSRELDAEIDPAKIYFVHHHLAHAASTYYLSGFDEALILTLDSQGEGIASMALHGHGGQLDVLRSLPQEVSTGRFYWYIIRFLGYDIFDEYKVMGLAPYGDPKPYRAVLQNLYQLLPEGQYQIFFDRIAELDKTLQPRQRGEPFTQQHQDFASSLQEALEAIVLHALQYFRKTTGLKRLCLAGGVAHNCTMNGKILYSGLFEDVFVQPASHDAGCALGAALLVDKIAAPQRQTPPLTQLYWGSDIGDNESIRQGLEPWSDLIDFEKLADVSEQVAELLASGEVVGWVQGRSEFGPRALGNRSILADPRPAANKDRINQMVKLREAYRPFAPSVLVENLTDYFEVPEGTSQLPYMVFVVKVVPEHRESLGAITHVDGTARVQTVSQQSNERYWRLIEAFGKRTGVPMLLNTSFNNHVEPIVDSLVDALVCFLTTNLDYLVVGDFLIRKKAVTETAYQQLALSLPSTADLRHVATDDRYEVYFTYDHGRVFSISSVVYELLGVADGRKALVSLFHERDIQPDQQRTSTDELLTLFSERIVMFLPPIE